MAPSATQNVDYEPDTFVGDVARNIRTVLAMQRRTAKDLAGSMGWNESKLSQRMGGASRWLAVDLLRLARSLGVSMDVLTAHTEDELKDALSRSRCFRAVEDFGQMELALGAERPVLVGVGS